jgi:hypothetical protein
LHPLLSTLPARRQAAADLISAKKRAGTESGYDFLFHIFNGLSCTTPRAAHPATEAETPTFVSVSIPWESAGRRFREFKPNRNAGARPGNQLMSKGQGIRNEK